MDDMETTQFDSVWYCNADSVPDAGVRLGVYNSGTGTYFDEWYYDFDHDGTSDEIDYVPVRPSFNFGGFDRRLD